MKPVPVTKTTLLEILADMVARIDADDSFEGSLEYLMPEHGAVTEDGQLADFEVMASYRVGNSMGQGGIRLVGAIE